MKWFFMYGTKSGVVKNIGIGLNIVYTLRAVRQLLVSSFSAIALEPQTEARLCPLCSTTHDKVVQHKIVSQLDPAD